MTTANGSNGASSFFLPGVPDPPTDEYGSIFTGIPNTFGFFFGGSAGLPKFDVLLSSLMPSSLARRPFACFLALPPRLSWASARTGR